MTENSISPCCGETRAQTCIRNINDALHDVTHSFIRIGYYLKEVKENGYYKEFGYQSIVEFAQNEFGIESTATYGLIQVYELAHDPDNPMRIAEQFEGYTHSKLLILARAKYVGNSFWKIVRPSDSVRELKQFVQNWNDEYKHGCGYHPQLKTVADYLDYYDKRDAAATNATEKTMRYVKQVLEYPGQLPGQVAMDLREEDEQEEPSEQEFSARAEKSDSAPAVMTDNELIPYCLKLGTVHGRLSKFIIIETYLQNSQNRLIESVQNEYGNGWFNPGSVYCKCIESDCKRLIITRATGGKIVMPWNVVAGHISKLITADEYLTEEEKEQYSRWKAEQNGVKVQTEQAEPEERNFSARAEKSELAEAEPPRPRTWREYLATLPNDELATQILLEVARIYPLGKNSATFISTMRKRLVERLSAPHGVNNGR